MKFYEEKIITTIVCVVLLLSMSIAAYASYSPVFTAYYKVGYNYMTFTGIRSWRKYTDNAFNSMVGYNKSSWLTPKTAIATISDYTLMTGYYSISNNVNVPVRAPSMAEAGNYYNVIVKGQVGQVGTDTMSFKYDLDT